MTSPDGFIPPNSFGVTTVGQLQDVRAESEGQLVNQQFNELLEDLRDNFLNGLLGGFGNVIEAIIAGVNKFLTDLTKVFTLGINVEGFEGLTALVNNVLGIVSGQPPPSTIYELKQASDRLEGIVAYGSFVMPQTQYIGGVLMGNRAQMAFTRALNTPYGMTQVGSSVQLDSIGLWNIDAQVRAQTTLFTGDDTIWLDIEVWTPEGTLYSKKSVDRQVAGNKSGVVRGGHTVTIERPGYQVKVFVWTGKWRWFFGGSEWTELTITKLSSEPALMPGAPGDPPEAGP
ncbi:hypothetical protein GS966_19960 [Rhodococcus hoagii]|nr:hypothetical protein [Prescottella equi]NKS73146.1 hypothetical protein [Prescottella equi]NKZ92202.1 hypothetical protein [Prescottella equi]